MHMPLEDTLGLNLLAANDHQADHNRDHFDAWRLLCLNVMSSPGAGKTSLLEQTLTVLSADLAMAVLEGDMTTQLDAKRLEAVGVPVVPITTGRACHLDAAMVSGGLKLLPQGGAAERHRGRRQTAQVPGDVPRGGLCADHQDRPAPLPAGRH